MSNTVDLLSSTDNPPPVPEGLSEAGERLWVDVTARYELRVDDLAVLHLAARQLGLCDHLADQMAGQPLTVAGSQGQSVIHPVLQELRQARGLFASLLRQLKLPDEIEEEQAMPMNPTSQRASKAAQARWSRERATNTAMGY